MKRLFAFFLIITLLLTSCGAPSADNSYPAEESSLAEGVIPDEFSIYIPGTDTEESSTPDVPYVGDVPAIKEVMFEDIPAAAIYDAETMAPIYEQNVYAHRSPASLTKLLTALVAVRFGDFDRVYTVGTELDFVADDASRANLRQGYKLTLEELLYGLLLCSGNDAAYTIAVNVARDVCAEPLDDNEAVNYFCGMMNETLLEFELFDSCFMTPDGYEAEGQYSSVYDLANIAQIAMLNETIRDIVSTSSLTVTIVSGQRMNWKNSNAFIRNGTSYTDPRVTGAKTGSTSAAGKCLVTTADIDGRSYIAVVLGCKTEKQRYGYSKELLDYVDSCN